MAMQNTLFIVGRWLAAAVFKVQIEFVYASIDKIDFVCYTVIVKRFIKGL